MEVPITGRLELFLFEAPCASVFMKWPESSRVVVVFSKSLNFFTIYKGNDERFSKSESFNLGCSIPLLFLAGVLRLKRRGILLVRPPLEMFDISDAFSLTVFSPFEWQLTLDLDPTLKLLNSIPFRELCLLRFNFGRDC